MSTKLYPTMLPYPETTARALIKSPHMAGAPLGPQEAPVLAIAKDSEAFGPAIGRKGWPGAPHLMIIHPATGTRAGIALDTSGAREAIAALQGIVDEFEGVSPYRSDVAAVGATVTYLDAGRFARASGMEWDDPECPLIDHVGAALASKRGFGQGDLHGLITDLETDYIYLLLWSAEPYSPEAVGPHRAYAAVMVALACGTVLADRLERAETALWGA
jgi:hypothetical protein